jgi:hypothetical protein
MMRLVALALAAFGVACAAPSTDYTPQIHVAPGAAARSLWILSRNAKKTEGEDAEAAAPSAEEEETGESEPSSAEGTAVPVHEVTDAGALE